ncbi:MAG: hypothetical protein AB7G11_16065 [Phycisphaerales bacterium]
MSRAVIKQAKPRSPKRAPAQESNQYGKTVVTALPPKSTRNVKPKTQEPPPIAVRAVTFSVDHVEGASWGDFQRDLQRCMGAAACLANWVMDELWARDARRDPRVEKQRMPKFQMITYDHVKRHYPFWTHWDGIKGSASSILRAVQRKYGQTRFKTRWMYQDSLSTFRDKLPFPVRAENTKVLYVEHVGADGQVSRRPAVQVRLGETLYTIVLSGGQEYRRQLADFRRIESGECALGEIALYRRKKGAGKESHHQVFVKLVAKLPVIKRATNKTLFLHTDPGAFWVAEQDDRQPWILNADQVARWRARYKKKAGETKAGVTPETIRRRKQEHEVYLQRIGEDTKFEKRWPKRMRRHINQSRQARCDKYNAKIDTWNHEATAMFAEFASRQGADLVVYDDVNRSYLPRYAWADLKTKLIHKLHKLGIAVRYVKDGDEDDEVNGTGNGNGKGDDGACNGNGHGAVAGAGNGEGPAGGGQGAGGKPGKRK